MGTGRHDKRLSDIDKLQGDDLYNMLHRTMQGQKISSIIIGKILETVRAHDVKLAILMDEAGFLTPPAMTAEDLEAFRNEYGIGTDIEVVSYPDLLNDNDPNTEPAPDGVQAPALKSASGLPEPKTEAAYYAAPNVAAEVGERDITTKEDAAMGLNSDPEQPRFFGKSIEELEAANINRFTEENPAPSRPDIQAEEEGFSITETIIDGSGIDPDPDLKSDGPHESDIELQNKNGIEVEEEIQEIEDIPEIPEIPDIEDVASEDEDEPDSTDWPDDEADERPE